VNICMSIFFVFLLFVVWFAFARKRTSHLQNKKAENFWEKESKANHTRKTSLECLEYITIPLNLIELCSQPDDAVLTECAKTLELLSAKKIVNLTGILNTDLKLKYGSANLPALMEYDQNFTQLIQTLDTASAQLKELGYTQSAIVILEFAVFIGSDISSTYRLLSSLYIETGASDKISTLEDSAKKLNTLMKSSILKHLKELR